MAIKSELLIYKIIEKYLRGSTEPMSCIDLWEHVEVRQNAISPEKVSDYLGLMWRRDLIMRWNTPVTSTSKSRYAYTWRDEKDADKPTPVGTPSKAPRLVSTGHKKANVTVTEDGDRLILDFDKFTMTIQAKG